MRTPRLRREEKRLREHLELRPDDPQALSDLAATRVTLAQRTDRPLLLLEALQDAQAARNLTPHSPQASYNFALALEKSFLVELAGEAWNDYLLIDSQSLFAREARYRQAQHRRAGPHAQTSDPTALCGTDDLRLESGALSTHSPRDWLKCSFFTWLPGWARAIGRRELDEAAHFEHLIRAASQRLASHDGPSPDRWLLETTEQIFSAGSADGPDKTSLLRALETLDDAYLLYQQDEDSAPLAFERVVPALSQGGDQAAALVEFYLACSLHEQNHLDESRRLLQRLLATTRSSPLLQASVHWMLGLNRMVADLPVEALEHYHLALELFTTAEDLPGELAMRTLSTEALLRLGRQDLALAEAYRSLSASPRLSDPTDRFRTLAVLAEMLDHLGLERAELLFRDELVVHASRDPSSKLELEARLDRLQLMVELDTEQSLLDQELARISELVEDRQLSESDRLQAKLRLLRYRPLALAPPSAQVLTEALEPLLDQERYYQASDILLARSAAWTQAGQLELAERDLEQLLGLLERARTETRKEDRRTAFDGLPRRFYDRAIHFHSQIRSDPRTAFNLAERSAALALPQRQKYQPTLRLAQVEERLPADTALLFYRALEDHLMAWVVADGDTQFYRLAPTARELTFLVKGLNGATGTGPWGYLTERAHDALLPPAPELFSKKRWVIVPDPSMIGLSFAALRDRRQGRFVLEAYHVRVSPSASFSLAATAPARPATRQLSLLALLAPTLDPNVYDLPELKIQSEREEIRQWFVDPTILEGSAATRDTFIRWAPRSDILHFSTHGFFVPKRPASSFLALAGPAQTSRLTAKQIYDLDLSRTRLAVLAACSTAGSAGLTEPGLAGLTRAFLAAGVPTVVGSLWDLDDSQASLLLADFYHHYYRTTDPTEALHQAQLQRLTADPTPDSAPPWAALQIFGR